jgi:hypothetical protein
LYIRLTQEEVLIKKKADQLMDRQLPLHQVSTDSHYRFSFISPSGEEKINAH